MSFRKMWRAKMEQVKRSSTEKPIMRFRKAKNRLQKVERVGATLAITWVMWIIVVVITREGLFALGLVYYSPFCFSLLGILMLWGMHLEGSLYSHLREVDPEKLSEEEKTKWQYLIQERCGGFFTVGLFSRFRELEELEDWLSRVQVDTR